MATSASSRVHGSASQNPYFRRVVEACASSRNSKRRRDLKFGLY